MKVWPSSTQDFCSRNAEATTECQYSTYVSKMVRWKRLKICLIFSLSKTIKYSRQELLKMMKYSRQELTKSLYRPPCMQLKTTIILHSLSKMQQFCQQPDRRQGALTKSESFFLENPFISCKFIKATKTTKRSTFWTFPERPVTEKNKWRRNELQPGLSSFLFRVIPAVNLSSSVK